jgi:hypothetical protein
MPEHGDVYVALATLMLAGLTGWLAWETRRMAKATQEMMALEAEPQLRVKDIVIGQSPTAIAGGVVGQHQIILWNPGKLVVYYQVDHWRSDIDGLSAASAVGVKRPIGVVHPAAEERFFCLTITVPATRPDPTPSRLEFDISYWTVKSKKRRLRGSIDQPIRFGPNRGPNPWGWIEGPNYTTRTP